MGNAGTQTSALSIGGDTGSVVAITEDWNGTSWVEVADLSTASRAMASGGTTTAAFNAGGFSNPGGVLNATEEWSGSSILTKVLSD